MEPYAYEPLPNTDWMRLLYVELVGDNQDDIHCSLRVVPMGRNYEYNALSYSWGMDGDGDASICERIIVDGKTLGLTRNLFEGLRRIFARPGRQRPTWIDAVCIDQSNINERNGHVARMAQIYANAEDVACWLGNRGSRIENDNIATLIKCFSSPNHSPIREHSIVSRDGSIRNVCMAHTTPSASQATTGTWFDTKSHPSEYDPFWDEVHGLLRVFLTKRYWRRTWIVQEICQARRPVSILWADQEVTEQQLQAVVGHIRFNSIMSHMVCPEAHGFQSPDAQQALFDSYKQLTDARNHLRGLFDLRRQFVTSSPLNMLSLAVGKCSGFDCSDPRDKIYALLSLDDETTIRPDYALATDRVYLAFSIELLHRNKCLPSMLKWAAKNVRSGTPQDIISTSLPSWCLDPRQHRDLDLINRETAIGAWSIDYSGLLTCPALVVGALSGDLATLEPTTKVASVDEGGGSHPQALSVMFGYDLPTIERARKARWKPGDLVCVFADIDLTIRANKKVEAVVLSLCGCTEGKTIYEVRSDLLFRPLAWTPGSHPVQTLCIQ